MEDLDETVSPGFEPLFINEDEEDRERAPMGQRQRNVTQSGYSFIGTQMNNFGLIKPYLKEMDDLLKSCEEMTSLPLSSHLSESYNEMGLMESTNTHRKVEGGRESYEEKKVSQQGYLYTRYIDTNMDGAGTQDKTAQTHSQVLASVSSRCGGSSDISCQREMPLTAAGHKLSDTMAEYEGQLSGMLSVLESCMEEAGMDFEPQDWVTDASQEYVHISKNHRQCQGATQAIRQQERPKMFESEMMKSESEAGQDLGRAPVFMLSRNEVTAGSPVECMEQNLDNSCAGLVGLPKEALEMEKTDESHVDTLSLFSDPSFNNGSTQCEVPKTGEVTGIEADYVGSGQADLCAVGSQMETCIQEVQQLEERRKVLLQEVLELRRQKDREKMEGCQEEVTEEPTERQVAELMDALKKEEEERREESKKEIQVLREERAEMERRMWKVNLEMHGLQEELRKLRRRLFAIARDCAHNQFLLNNQHHQVDVLKREEEELESLVLQLTEQIAHLHTAHEQQISKLQAVLQSQMSSHTSSTQDELTECRRHSCGDIQQFLQGELRALEDRFEPILMALLKRREVTAEALVKAKVQTQELRTQLGPLKDEIEKLKLQGACLEEKLKLTQIQRTEDMEHYKQIVYCLEESTRELKTELKLQKRKNKDMEELRDTLSKQLLLYRAANEDHAKKT